jgi:hypothetical protein
VQDPAGLAGWPLRWWQPPGLALAVAAAALGGGGVRLMVVEACPSGDWYS